MNVLSQAIKEYNNENYAVALSLFQQAASIYGERIVELQLKKCREKLNGQSPNAAIPAQTAAATAVRSVIETAPLVQGELDLATKLLLANMGQMGFSETEKSELQQRWKKLVAKKSEDAEVKKVDPIPADFPKDLQLAPLPEGVNDFIWYRNHKRRLNQISPPPKEVGLSIVIPTFNRSWILSITLACLCNQKTAYPFEVIVADDGSKEDLMPVIRKYEQRLDVKYVRQKDYGYQLCAVRNLGLRTAKYEFVSILDCDMAPNPLWVNSYIDALLEDDDVALIGPRKYVDTNNIDDEQFLNNANLIESLPEVRTNNNVAGKSQGEISVDWRLEHFKKSENLRLCDSPFRYFSGGNVAFAKKWLSKAGWFDEEFTHWGGEDNEFGYRLFKKGCFFRSLDGGMAFHQEPPGKENETDRDAGKKITLNIVREKVPYFYRKLETIETAHLYRVPLVSIYIPAYNCANTIQRCVDSALNQTVTDLEVCICNDGSTDNSLDVIKALYGNNPRVKILSKANGGIASASNLAVSEATGYYIAQLDADDYLEPDAVELCLKEFLKDRSLACVYTTNRNVNPDGSLIANGYNWPVFSREKLTTAMIVHHFRMFTARAWHLTAGFDEKIANSVDLDIYLKLSEVGEFKHINKICYNRVLHGNNTSIKNLGLQKKNHFIVVNNSLRRQGISHYEYAAIDEDDASRRYSFKLNDSVSSPITVQSQGIATAQSLATSQGIATAQGIATQNGATQPQTSNNATTGKLAISLVYPNKLDGLVNKLSNLAEYNPEITVVAVHIDNKHLTQKIQTEIAQLEQKYQFKVRFNTELDYANEKYRQVEYHASNFNQLIQSGIAFDYFIIDNPDSLWVKKQAYAHLQKADIGMNYGNINGYWQDKILSHKSLAEWAKTHLNKELADISCKGTAHGLFMKTEIAKSVFDLISQFNQICRKNNDFPKYLTEEVLFQMMALTLEKQGKRLKRQGTLTYLPWDRKLQWTAQQIEQAKQGIGIAKDKFIINKFEF